MWFWWINSSPLWPPSWLTTQQDWPEIPGWISNCIWSRDCGVRQWLSSSILSWFTFNVMAGYAWDLQPLLELISTTALITLILHLTFNWMFTGVRQRSWLLRLILLFLLVLLTLQSISRYHNMHNTLTSNWDIEVLCIMKMSSHVLKCVLMRIVT